MCEDDALSRLALAAYAEIERVTGRPALIARDASAPEPRVVVVDEVRTHDAAAFRVLGS